MTDKDYIKRLANLKQELDSLTNDLWRIKSIRQDYVNKEYLLDHIIDDVFTYEKNVLNIQINK